MKNSLLRFNPYLSGLLLVTASIVAGGAVAQDLKIGVVNVPRMIEESPQAKSVMEALQDEFAPLQRTLVGLQKDLREKEERLQRDGQVLGESERGNLERDIRDERRDLARKQNEYLEDLNLRRNEVLGSLQRELLQEVQAYARAAAYDLVVADVLFASSAVDITPEVLKALSERYAKENP
jgi:outer membrane protein